MSDVIQDTNHFQIETPTDNVELLGYTTRIRINLLNRIMECGEDGEGPDIQDSKLMNTATKLLAGLDAQIINSQRIEASSKNSDAIADLATALDGFVLDNGSGFQRIDQAPSVAAIEGEYEHVTANLVLPEMEFIDGMLDPVGAAVDLDKIMSENRPNNKEG